MKKITIISHEGEFTFTDAINRFIANHDVTDIQYQMGCIGDYGRLIYSAMIIYETR